MKNVLILILYLAAAFVATVILGQTADEQSEDLA